jgi:hypothetical protein
MSVQRSTTTDFTRLSIREIDAEIDAIAREADATFGRSSALQLNWQPAPGRWSVAQCFDHLIRINGLMVDGMARALATDAPRRLVQRLPGLPRMLGRVMIRSLAPTATRKLRAPAPARPSTSDLDEDILRRFVEAQASLRDRLRAMEHRDLPGTIMVSPFASVVAYSVLDAWRIIVAHERRHFEQARRVTQTPGFPG